MATNRWWEYVATTIGEDSALEAGRRAGFDASAFTRWKKGARPDVAFVVKLARAYRRPVVEALAAAEFITDAEAGIREVQVGVEDLSEVELARELLRRVEVRSRKVDRELHLVQPLRDDEEARPDLDAIRAMSMADKIEAMKRYDLEPEDVGLAAYRGVLQTDGSEDDFNNDNPDDYAE